MSFGNSIREQILPMATNISKAESSQQESNSNAQDPQLSLTSPSTPEDSQPSITSSSTDSLHWSPTSSTSNQQLLTYFKSDLGTVDNHLTFSSKVKIRMDQLTSDTGESAGVASSSSGSSEHHIKETVDVTAGQGNMNQNCKVCGEPAAGFHFGAFTCEGCKSFFGRTHNNLMSLNECKSGSRCVINKRTRTTCKSCRLRKCLLVGMSKSGSRYGRRSNWFKVHYLMQNENSNTSSETKEDSPGNVELRIADMTSKKLRVGEHSKSRDRSGAINITSSLLGSTELSEDLSLVHSKGNHWLYLLPSELRDRKLPDQIPDKNCNLLKRELDVNSNTTPFPMQILPNAKSNDVQAFRQSVKSTEPTLPSLLELHNIGDTLLSRKNMRQQFPGQRCPEGHAASPYGPSNVSAFPGLYLLPPSIIHQYLGYYPSLMSIYSQHHYFSQLSQEAKLKETSTSKRKPEKLQNMLDDYAADSEPPRKIFKTGRKSPVHLPLQLKSFQSSILKGALNPLISNYTTELPAEYIPEELKIQESNVNKQEVEDLEDSPIDLSLGVEKLEAHSALRKTKEDVKSSETSMKPAMQMCFQMDTTSKGTTDKFGQGSLFDIYSLSPT